MTKKQSDASLEELKMFTKRLKESIRSLKSTSEASRHPPPEKFVGLERLASESIFARERAELEKHGGYLAEMEKYRGKWLDPPDESSDVADAFRYAYETDEMKRNSEKESRFLLEYAEKNGMSMKSSESINTFKSRIEAKIKQDSSPKTYNNLADMSASETFVPPRIPYKACSFATREETRQRFIETDKSYVMHGYTQGVYETYINGMIVICDKDDIMKMRHPYPDFMDMLKEI